MRWKTSATTHQQQGRSTVFISTSLLALERWKRSRFHLTPGTCRCSDTRAGCKAEPRALQLSSMKPPAKILRICCHYGMTTAADAVQTVEAHCC